MAAMAPSYLKFFATESTSMPANDPRSTAPSIDSQLEITDALEHAYFRHLSPEDQHALGEQGRATMVQSHLALAADAGTEPKIGIVQAPRHAIVQVVHPDIRYLVDSVSTEIGRAHV